jgi:signal transduction histidine kinase
VPELEESSLPEALATAARQAVGERAVAVNVGVEGTPRRLQPAIEAAAFRIGGEALTNAVRHAEPRRIDVTLQYQSTVLILEVRDDGKGLASADPARAIPLGHWGLRGMRERAEREGGALEVRGEPGCGTVVRLVLPADGQ